MSTLHLIIKSTRLDKRKFITFLLILGLIIGFWYLKNSTFFKAETEIPDNIAPTLSTESINFSLNSSGLLYDIQGKLKAKATFEKTSDSLRFVALKNNDTMITEQLIYIKLPSPDTKKAIHVTVNSDGTLGTERIYYLDAANLAISINDVAPGSVISLSLTFPKEYLKPGILQLLRSKLDLISLSTLVIIGSLIPIITILTLLVLLYKSTRRRVVSTKSAPVTAPPDQTPPAVIGVLYRGKIGPREIAATLLDLANRGYLHVYRDQDEFRFAIPSFLGDDKFKDIKPFEKFLLSKLFQPDKMTSDVKEIGYRIGRHVFSRKITAVLLDIYQQAVINGYFTVNPAHLHKKFKMLAILEFFLGVVGLALSFIFDNNYQGIFLVIFVSTIISSFLVFVLAPTLPQRTESGAATLKQWLAFQKFLSKHQPVAYNDQIQEVYLNYLPYAIVFEVEVEWANRFSKSPFKMPEWLDMASDLTTVEDFANNIYPLVGYVGSIILQSRVPVMD